MIAKYGWSYKGKCSATVWPFEKLLWTLVIIIIIFKARQHKAADRNN